MKRYLFALTAVLLSTYACSSSHDDPDPDPEDAAIASQQWTYTAGTGEGTFSLPVISMDITLPGTNAFFVIPVIFNGTGVSAGTCYSVEPTYIFGDIADYYFYEPRRASTTAANHTFTFNVSYSTESAYVNGIKVGVGDNSGSFIYTLATIGNRIEHSVNLSYYMEYVAQGSPESLRIGLVANVLGGKKGDVIHLEIPDGGAISLTAWKKS